MAHLLNHSIAHCGCENTEITDAIQLRNNKELHMTEDLFADCWKTLRFELELVPMFVLHILFVENVLQIDCGID